MLFNRYTAVVGLLLASTIEADTVTVSPDVLAADGATVATSSSVTVIDGVWNIDGFDAEWALGLTLDGGAYGFVPDATSTTSFLIDGVGNGDHYLGFGDGTKYFNIFFSLDGGHTYGDVAVYPQEYGELVSGAIQNLLDAVGDNAGNTDYRDALAGGSTSNWKKIQDSGNWNFPVLLTIENDLANNQVHCQFSDPSQDGLSVAWSYTGFFATESALFLGATKEESYDIKRIDITTAGGDALFVTPGRVPSDVAVATSASVSVDPAAWHLTAYDDHWGVMVTLDANTYGFRPSEASTLTMKVDGYSSTSDSDHYFGFGDGSLYFNIFFAAAPDNGHTYGDVAVYPTPGGSLAGGAIVDLLVSATKSAGGYRDALAGGDDKNFKEQYESGTNWEWPLTLTVANDPTGSRVVVTFESANDLSTSWEYANGAFATDSDLYFGATREESYHIESITVSSSWDSETPTPTQSPTRCDAANIHGVNWHKVVTGADSAEDLLKSVSIEHDAATLSLTFSVSLEYVGLSADGNFDKEFNLGTSYWIDFESFSMRESLYAPGTCSNRKTEGSSISEPAQFADFWLYPDDPLDLITVTDAERTAYPASEWTLSAVSSSCNEVEYRRTMTWSQLTSCSDGSGNKLIEVTQTDDAVVLEGTFFVDLISPYSMSTNNIYRTLPIVTGRRFSIVIDRKVDVIASTNVQLFISSVMAYGRDGDGKYEVTVLIQSADYVQFDLDSSAAVTAPSGITVSAVESFVGDCLVSSSFTCGQIFTAKIDASCPDDGAVDLSGLYQFAFTPQCRVQDDGSNYPECDTFLTTLDESAGKVALEVDASFADQCDLDLFEVDFTGDLAFYSDDQFAVEVDGTSDPFVIGQDTIFGKLTVNMASFTANIAVSGITIETVYVCTAAPAADLSLDSVTGLGGCLSTNIDVNQPYNVIGGTGAVPEYEGTIIATTEQNEARFSFLTFATPRDDIYIHVQALLDLTIGSDAGRRRVRMLLQDDGEEANQFRSFVGTAAVIEDPDSNLDDVQPADGAEGRAVAFVSAMFVFTAWIMA